MLSFLQVPSWPPSGIVRVTGGFRERSRTEGLFVQGD